MKTSVKSLKYWVEHVYTGYFVCFAFSLKNCSFFIMLMFILIFKQKDTACSISENYFTTFFEEYQLIASSIDSGILKMLNFKLENIFLNLHIAYSIWKVQNPYVYEQSTCPSYTWQRAFIHLSPISGTWITYHCARD